MSMSRLMVGAAVGFIAGLLLAPDKGENTRKSLATAAEDWGDRLNRMMGKASVELDDLRGYLEQDISGLGDDVRSRILTILDEAEEMAYSPRTHVSNGAL
jgi:gas vesicle protein